MDETATRTRHTSQLKDTRYDSRPHYDLYHIATYKIHYCVHYMSLLLLYICHTTAPIASVRVTTLYTTTQQTYN